MPSVRSSNAPHFSCEEEEHITEFLRKYENIANSCRLTSDQKVETILLHAAHLHHLRVWKTLPEYRPNLLLGDQAGDWDDFLADLEELYLDAKGENHDKHCGNQSAMATTTPQILSSKGRTVTLRSHTADLDSDSDLDSESEWSSDSSARGY